MPFWHYKLLCDFTMSVAMQEKKDHDASHLEQVSINDGSKSSNDGVDQGENKVC